MRYEIDSIKSEGDEITVLVAIKLDMSELSKLLNIQQLVTGYPTLTSKEAEEAAVPFSKKTLKWQAKQLQPKRKRRGRRAGKKLREMSREELHAYWREKAAIKRNRLLDEKQDLTPTGKKVMNGLQRNADTIKKIKEEFPNEDSERP